jgi:vitamin B12 transporter
MTGNTEINFSRGILAVPVLVALSMTGLPAGAQTASAPPEARQPVLEVIGLRPASADTAPVTVSSLNITPDGVRDGLALANALRAVPGVAVSRSGGQGSLTQVRLRGAEANHTLVLLNGVEVSDPITGETDFGLWQGLAVDRVDVLRGEQSGLYGSDAIGGVVAVTLADVAGLRGGVSAGSLETGTLRLQAGHAAGPWRVGGAFNALTTAGVDTSGRGGETDGLDARMLSLTAQTRFGANVALNALALVTDSEAQIDADTTFDGRLDDVNRQSETRQTVLGVRLNVEGALNHRLTAAWTGVTRTNRADGRRTDRTEGERVKLGWSPALVLGRWQLAGLFEAEREDYDRDGPDFGFASASQKQTFDSAGLAGEAAGRFGAWTLSASLRQDFNDGRFEDATTGRLGASLATASAGTFRASAGTGVKNPTFTELFGFFPNSFRGNPALRPERSESVEVGWGYRAVRWEIGATVFSARLEDEIITVFDSNFNASPANRAGRSTREGLELEAAVSLTPTVTARGMFTALEAEERPGEAEIRRPRRTASLSVEATKLADQRLQAGLALDYVGAQSDVFFGPRGQQRVRLNGYWLATGSARWDLNDRVGLTLRTENLFDEAVVDVFGYTAPGRTWMLGLVVR